MDERSAALHHSCYSRSLSTDEVKEVLGQLAAY
jgi:hypothetical protein